MAGKVRCGMLSLPLWALRSRVHGYATRTPCYVSLWSLPRIGEVRHVDRHRRLDALGELQ